MATTKDFIFTSSNLY